MNEHRPKFGCDAYRGSVSKDIYISHKRRRSLSKDISHKSAKGRHRVLMSTPLREASSCSRQQHSEHLKAMISSCRAAPESGWKSLSPAQMLNEAEVKVMELARWLSAQLPTVTTTGQSHPGTHTVHAGSRRRTM